MKLECQQCHRMLNLPDAKLPVGRPFSFNCPYCKQKNTAQIPAQAPDEAPPVPPEEAAAPPEPEPQYASTYRLQPAPEAPEIAYPPPTDLELDEPVLQTMMFSGADERPKALVVYDDEETAESLVRKLDFIGYQATVAVNLRDAAKQLKFVNFNLMLIQEDYYGATLSGNHLLRAVQTLDNQSRRGMLVVLLSPALTTLDDLTAFSLSLDAVVNQDDLETIDRILLSIIARAKKFYAIYREILAEHGLD